MSTKKKEKPKSHETMGKTKVFMRMFADQMKHPAFKDLKGNAVKLYDYMKLQLYGQKTIPGYSEEYFYFNRAMYLIDEEKYPDNYGIYSSCNQFQRDKKELIEHGFIEVAECNYSAKDKNVYKFSDKWQQWEIPEEQKRKRREKRERLKENLKKT